MNRLNERAKAIDEDACHCRKKKPGRSRPWPLDPPKVDETLLKWVKDHNSRNLSITYHDGKELQRNPNTTQKVDEDL